MRLAVVAAALLWSSLPARADDPSTDQADSTAAPPSEAAPAAPSEGPGAAPAAASEAPAVAPSPAAAAPAGEPPARGRSRSSQWGILADLGFPEGAALSAEYRPVSSVRFWAGPAWNYVGWGLQGGVAVVPWHWAVTPVLSAELGRYFGADVSFLAREGSGVPPELKPLLEDMSYSYGAVHAGIELGSQSGLVFSIRGGLAYLSLRTRGTVTATDASGSTVTFTDPRVRGTIPSLKLGVHFWF